MKGPRMVAARLCFDLPLKGGGQYQDEHLLRPNLINLCAPLGDSHMVRRLVLAAVIVLFAATPAFAQLDAETKQPYHWRVVLSAKPHPLVTTDFRERVRRDVIAALQTGIGPLGTVEVIDLADLPRDRWDPLWS